ncbi:hypothetical protein [Arsenicicoccus bolidensis]|uniref:hypothetical protein n=1 Tax=Arsenicicoccus bolidensis TaxID=229480 RepID=UPI0004256C55|nr:hypothetical protein [Arsenicicoccus bolidensis]
MSDIALTVDDGRPADAARFFAAGTHLLDLLDDLAETADVEWTVAELRRASAVAELVSAGDHRQAGVVAVRSAMVGLEHIRAGKGLPPDWTPNAVGHAKDMVRRAGEHAKLESNGNVVWLDQTLRAELESIAPWVREFYGSMRGEMTGVNVTRGNRASIKPQGGGRVVHVGFPTPLAEAMRDGLLQFVEVEGMIRQNEDGRTYYVTAEKVSVVVEPTITWQDLRGYMPEITDGLPIAKYLEGIRGEK